MEVPLPLLQAVGELPEEASAWASRISRTPSSCMRRACSPSWSTPSSTPSPRRWPTAACCTSGGGCSMPALSRLWRRSLETGGRAGRTPGPPCPAGRGVGQGLAYCQQAGEKAMARSAHREAVGYFEQALSALPHLPEQRATRAGHRSPARPALGAPAVGDWGVSWRAARGRGPRGGPR